MASWPPRVWIEAQVFPEFTDAMSTKARGGVLQGSSRRIDVLATLTGHAIDPTTPGGPVGGGSGHVALVRALGGFGQEPMPSQGR